MSEEKLDLIDPDTSAYKILCHLTFKSLTLKPAELADQLGENGSTVRARLAELKKQGLVDSKPEGYISLISPYDLIMKVYRDLQKDTKS